MSLIKTLFDFSFFKRIKPPEFIPSGIYHYMRESDGFYTRFHLRVDPDGSGIFLANASVAARLSKSGVIIAKGLLENENQKKIINNIFKYFKGVSAEKILKDIEQVKAIISNLCLPEDNYPILNLEDAALSPYESRLMAPLRADVPLAEPEKLILIIDRLWEIGIPHINLLVYEKSEPSYLLRAIEHAEDLGMITGLRARGSDLKQNTLLKDLAMAGIDHITVPFASLNQEVHNALWGEDDFPSALDVFSKILELEVCPVGEIPLIESTLKTLSETIVKLSENRVTNISFFAIAVPQDTEKDKRSGALTANALPQVGAIIEEASHEAQVRYLWQPPVLRDFTKSISEQVHIGPRCSGDVSVRIEPDGSVIPPRGAYRIAGNLLTDTWDKIWGNEAFRIYRERVEAPTRCDVCPGLVICAADCPREPSGWSS